MSTQVWIDSAPPDFTPTARYNSGTEEPFAVIEVTPVVSVVLNSAAVGELLHALAPIWERMDPTATFPVEMCQRCADEDTDRKVAARYATREQVTAPVTPETHPWSP